MGLLVGPTPWWQASIVSQCPEGSFLPDGSTIICKSGGTAWIIAPSCTEAVQTWNGTTNTQVGDKCCISEWSSLETQLINCGFNPNDWFVPSVSQLQNPGYVCRTNWDSFSVTFYWSSTEIDATYAYGVGFCNGNALGNAKTSWCAIRAMRCVTY